MNRREFLRLTVRGQEPVLELHCERLYMRYVDAEAGVGMRGPRPGSSLEMGDWLGEPPIEIDVPTTEDVFAELERRLAGVRALRLVGREWLAKADFRHEVESMIESFRRRGGRVE